MAAAKKTVPWTKRRRRQALVGAAYIAPSFILMMIFNVFTMLCSVYLSFTKYNMVKSPNWVGVANYVKLFSNSALRAGLSNTVRYVLMTVPVQTILALLIAAFIAERMQNRFGSFLRSVIFVPVIVSLIASATVWEILYAANGGVINQLLGLIGIPPVNFLGSKNTALWCVAVVSIWKNTGYYMVIYYAGIMGISPELREAAIVDGAGAVQRFLRITLPLLKPISYMVITMGIIGSFQVFDLVYKMTGGGPGRSTYTVAYLIYSFAFQDKNFGTACALAVCLMLVILAIHALQSLLFREKEG